MRSKDLYKKIFLIISILSIIFLIIKKNKNNTYSTKDKFIKNYKLVWHDEFNGNNLNLSKWNYRSIGKRKLGYITKNAISVKNGILKIKVYYKNGKIFSGMISTQNKFETKYGYFEIKAKIPHVSGPQFAFWLQSPKMGKVINNTFKSGAEIDIMEYIEKTPNKIYFSIHWNGYKKYAKHYHYSITYPKINDNNWHTFGLLWDKHGYKFYIDGKLFHQTKTALSKTKEYIILSAEFGKWGGKIDIKKLPAFYEIDYVRVYKKKSDF